VGSTGWVVASDPTAPDDEAPPVPVPASTRGPHAEVAATRSTRIEICTSRIIGRVLVFPWNTDEDGLRRQAVLRVYVSRRPQRCTEVVPDGS
jgi:hypothetical protein